MTDDSRRLDARLAANWRAVTAELDSPRPRMTERVLRRAGLPARITRLALATPGLRRAWFITVAVVVVVGLGAAEPDDPASLFTFLVLTPMLPVVGVAMAFGPTADPMYEAQLATPMRGVRLVALRAAVVQVVSIAIVGVVALLAPTVRSAAVAWLLPALALTAAALAAMTVTTPRRAAAGVAVTWLLAVGAAGAIGADRVAAFGAVGQLVAVAVAIAAGAAAHARRDRFDRMVWAS